jgi:hypothetical protein
MKTLQKLIFAAQLVYVMLVYAVPISMFFVLKRLATIENHSGLSGLLTAFGAPLFLMLIVCGFVLLNIVLAVLGTLNHCSQSFRKTLIFKLAVTPFFIVNFAVWLIGSMVFHTSFVVIPLLPIIIPYTYFVMIGTSAHNIANLARYKLDKRITAKQCALHIVLQLLFTIDVVDGIVLAAKQNKWVNDNEK